MAGTLKQIATAFAGFATGFTLKDFLSYGIRKFHMRRERCKDDKVVEYLAEEVKSSPPEPPDILPAHIFDLVAKLPTR